MSNLGHILQSGRKMIRRKFSIEEFRHICDQMYTIWSEQLSNMNSLCTNLKLLKTFMLDPGKQAENNNERIISMILLRPCKPDHPDFTSAVGYVWKLLLSHEFCVSNRVSIRCVTVYIEYMNEKYNKHNNSRISVTSANTVNNDTRMSMMTNKYQIIFINTEN